MSRRRTALLAVLLLATPGEAAVLCRAGTGKLALREACRKVEQVVTPAEIDVSSLMGPPGDSGAQGPHGRHPIAVVDSAGTEVGSTVFIDPLGIRALVVVTHPALTETLLFDVNRGGFTPNTGGGLFSTVFYGALDCAGVPHVASLWEESCARPRSTAIRCTPVAPAVCASPWPTSDSCRRSPPGLADGKGHDMRIVAALVLGMLIGPCTDAGALVLCSKKRKVVARATCRPNETVLSLVGLGSPGSKGTAGAQGPVGGPPLRVVDAVENDVGPLVSVDSSGSTSPNLDLVLFLALVTRPPLTDGALLGFDAAGRPTGGRLFYASSDCSGTPLLVRKGLIASVQVIGDTVFAPDGPSADPMAGSVEGNELSLGCVGITPRGGCCRTTSITIPFDTAVPVATLAELGIVPPLRAVLAQ